jgi:hypothetical protein
MKFNIERLENVKKLIRFLAVGLKNLKFEDNFNSFKKTSLVIPATSESKIRNELTVTPSKYIITLQTGNGLVTKSVVSGSTWDTNFVYLYNNGSNEVTIDVTFLE